MHSVHLKRNLTGACPGLANIDLFRAVRKLHVEAKTPHTQTCGAFFHILEFYCCKYPDSLMMGPQVSRSF
ncbi:hypothetical protein AFAE65S_00246 [Alcaligenes phenolicus]